MWSGINKRKFPRAEYPCKITVRRKDKSVSLSSQTQNIGIGGICTVLPRDLGIFAPVEIQLDLLDNKPAVQCDGSIVWIVEQKQQKNKLYDTGIEFTTLKKNDTERIDTIVKKILGESAQQAITS